MALQEKTKPRRQQLGLVPPPPPEMMQMGAMPQGGLPMQVDAGGAPAGGGTKYGIDFPPPPAVSLTPNDKQVADSQPDFLTFANQANQVYGNQHDYKAGGEILDRLADPHSDHRERLHKITNAIDKLGAQFGLDINSPDGIASAMADIQSDDSSAFGADQGLIGSMLTFGSRRKAAVQANQRAKAANLIGIMQFMHNAIKTGNDEDLNLAKQYLEQGKEYRNLLEDAGKFENQKRTDERIKEIAGNKLELGQGNLAARMAGVEQKDQLLPHQIAAMEALTGQRSQNTDNAAITGQYLPLTLGAKVNNLNAMTAAVPQRTAAMQAQATGGQITPELAPGLVQGTPEQPMPLNPKAQQAATNAGPTNLLHEMQAQKVGAEATIMSQKALDSLIRKTKARIDSGVSGGEYWKSHPKEFAQLPDEMKANIKELYLQGK